ncbi:MAG: hypothetical protein WD872_09295 [Pirellulaceae bacterium]
MLVQHLILIGCLAAGQVPAPSNPAELSRRILDDALPADERQQLASDSADQAAEIVAALIADLPADDPREEYRRIPWIWRVSVAAGKQNQEAPLRKLLAVSLPRPGEGLRDWQAVVIGGGIVGGISLSGDWPRQRIEKLLAGDEALRRRWQQSITAAAAMADNEQVKAGTRYDALRMIALDPTDKHLAQLAKYLGKDANAELQMGAVSGLADVDDPRPGQLLADAMPSLTTKNRGLAVDALLRSPARTESLLGLIESGKLDSKTLSAEQRKKLRALPDAQLRQRAEKLLSP